MLRPPSSLPCSTPSFKSRFFLDDKDLDTFENLRDGASVAEKFMERELNHVYVKDERLEYPY